MGGGGDINFLLNFSEWHVFLYKYAAVMRARVFEMATDLFDRE